jgi:hypothetical protein
MNVELMYEPYRILRQDPMRRKIMSQIYSWIRIKINFKARRQIILEKFSKKKPKFVS